MLEGINIDNVINEIEVIELDNWWKTHFDLISKTPFNEVIPLVKQVCEDKKIADLTATQKKLVSGFDYDKNGRAHYTIETRASARQALLTYHKLLSQKQSGTENKRSETTVTLEIIREKATAKLSIIQNNKVEAESAGDFFETMQDMDEEA